MKLFSKLIFAFMVGLSFLKAANTPLSEEGQKMNYLYDEHKVRYTLVSSNGGKAINWVFFPGGPGCDSLYLLPLAQELKLDGNIWLIDFPGNGSNLVEEPYNYDLYLDLFPKVINRFTNVVLVGHSFGGMLPLLHPKLEEQLKGLILLNTSPSLWLEEAANVAKALELPDLSEDMGRFTNSPNQETFNLALSACAPYYFTPSSFEKGREWLSTIPFRWQPAVWWQQKAIQTEYTARWIPSRLKTLIIGAEFDAMTPLSLFEKDQQFNRSNISIIKVANAGHMPWFEKTDEVVKLIQDFQSQLKF